MIEITGTKGHILASNEENKIFKCSCGKRVKAPSVKAGMAWFLAHLKYVDIKNG